MRRAARLSLIVSSLILGSTELQVAYAAEPQEGVVHHDVQQKIDKALSQEIDFDFTDVPIAEAAAILRDKLKVDFSVDQRALEDDGIDAADVQVDFQAKGISARAGLRLFLEQLDLTYTVEDDAVTLTTPTAAENRLLLRAYPVADLLTGDEAAGFDYDELVDLITSIVRPESWGEVGGPASGVHGIHGQLVLSQTQDVHDSIASLLATMREAAKLEGRADRPVMLHSGEWSPSGDRGSEQSLRNVLDQPTMLPAGEIPLLEWVETVTHRYHIPVILDRRGLEDDGLAVDKIVVQAEHYGVSLRTTLNRVTRSLELQWTIRNEVVFITTPAGIESRMTIKVYPVDDLVEPVAPLVPAVVVAGPYTIRSKTADVTSAVERPDRKGNANAPGEVTPQMLGGVGFVGSPPFPASFSGTNFDPLSEILVNSVAESSWADVGGAGSVMEYEKGKLLVILQTESTHQQISQLLTSLRRQRPAVESAESKNGASTGAAETSPVKLVVYQIHADEEGFEQQLGDAIQRFVEPESWGNTNLSEIQAVEGALFIRQTETVHNRIHELLVQLADLRPGAGFPGNARLGNGFMSTR